MRTAFSVTSVRQAEAELMAFQRHDDELMKLAARAVAHAAYTMLNIETGQEHSRRVLVVAGAGGNGGDGLFATSQLRYRGVLADAILTGENVHQEALSAFLDAEGLIIDDIDSITDYDLIIDAIAGLASARPLEGKARAVFAAARAAGIPVLAVDVPTGIAADTGVTAGDSLDDYVQADVTVTFGRARQAHAIAPDCGVVLVSDLHLPDGPESFAEVLDRIATPVAYLAQEPSLPSAFDWASQRDIHNNGGLSTAPLPVGCVGPIPDPTPGNHDDKYSRGVVALCAGSPTYPGAGVLAAAGAMGASPSMVRVIGSPNVVAVHPEVVAHADVKSAGRSQAWVVGPGRGIEGEQRAELRQVLQLGQPTVVDADALTVLADDEDLRELVAAHPCVVLTPHAGEFDRLYRAVFGRAPGDNPVDYVAELAAKLQAYVIHKGRVTIISALGDTPVCINAGNSYAATPGSGDVLSGIVGKALASGRGLPSALWAAVAIHAHAAAIAALTPDGYAPTTASRIAAAIPQAVARLLAAQR